MVAAADAELVTVAEAAHELKVDKSTIRRWISDGSLPACKVGPRFVRIRRTDLDGLVRPANRTVERAQAEYPPVTEVDDREPTAANLQATIQQLERARALRERMEQKYGVFEPPTWQLIREMREERIEQLP